MSIFYSDGAYWLKAILPGTYRLSFYKQGAGYDMEEFYSAFDRVYNFSQARDVVVVADKTTANIDLILGPDRTLYLPMITKGK